MESESKPLEPMKAKYFYVFNIASTIYDINRNVSEKSSFSKNDSIVMAIFYVSNMHLCVPVTDSQIKTIDTLSSNNLSLGFDTQNLIKDSTQGLSKISKEVIECWLLDRPIIKHTTLTYRLKDLSQPYDFALNFQVLDIPREDSILIRLGLGHIKDPFNKFNLPYSIINISNQFIYLSDLHRKNLLREKHIQQSILARNPITLLLSWGVTQNIKQLYLILVGVSKYIETGPPKQHWKYMNDICVGITDMIWRYNSSKSMPNEQKKHRIWMKICLSKKVYGYIYQNLSLDEICHIILEHRCRKIVIEQKVYLFMSLIQCLTEIHNDMRQTDVLINVIYWLKEWFLYDLPTYEHGVIFAQNVLACFA